MQTKRDWSKHGNKAKDIRAISVVTTPSFNTLITCYNVPSRQNLIDSIFPSLLQEAEKYLQAVAEEIENCSLTLDLWTSKNATLSMAITLLFFNSSSPQLQSNANADPSHCQEACAWKKCVVRVIWRWHWTKDTGWQSIKCSGHSSLPVHGAKQPALSGRFTVVGQRTRELPFPWLSYSMAQKYLLVQGSSVLSKWSFSTCWNNNFNHWANQANQTLWMMVLLIAACMVLQDHLICRLLLQHFFRNKYSWMQSLLWVTTNALHSLLWNILGLNFDLTWII